MVLRFPTLRLSLLALQLLLASCTSIHWSDREGRQHHLGLVAVRTTELARGTEVTSYALGADLRLAGANPGYSVGYTRTSHASPEEHAVASSQFGEKIAAYLRDPGSFERRGRPRWRFLYYREPHTRDAVRLDGATVGLLWAGGERHSLSVGYDRTREIVGRPLSEDHALFDLHDGAMPGRRQLTLWTPLPPGSPIHPEKR